MARDSPCTQVLGRKLVVREIIEDRSNQNSLYECMKSSKKKLTKRKYPRLFEIWVVAIFKNFIYLVSNFFSTHDESDHLSSSCYYLEYFYKPRNYYSFSPKTHALYLYIHWLIQQKLLIFFVLLRTFYIVWL